METSFYYFRLFHVLPFWNLYLLLSPFCVVQFTLVKILCLFTANFVLLPFNYLVSSSYDTTRNPLAESSLRLLLIHVHYRKCVLEEILKNGNIDHTASDFQVKENTYLSENPFCKTLESSRDIEFDRVDIEGNAHSGPLVRLPFAPLFDTLGMYLSDEISVLMLYSPVHGNSDFLEYVLVRTDLDTLLMPLLETLYNGRKGRQLDRKEK